MMLDAPVACPTASLGTDQGLNIALNRRPGQPTILADEQLRVGNVPRTRMADPFAGRMVLGKSKNFGHKAKVETYL